MRHILRILFIITALCSCSKEPQLATEQVVVSFTSSNITRSGDANVDAESYMFSVYGNSSNRKNLDCVYTAGEEGALTPDGTGLVANNGTYKLAIASPAQTMVQVGSTTTYGHQIKRLSENPYISAPINLYIDGFKTGSRYIYDLGGVTLRQQRSKVKVEFKTAGDERTVKTLRFSNVYNSGYSCPILRMRYDDIVAEEVCEFADFPNGVGEVKYNSTTAVTATTTDDDGETDYTYLISDDYSKSDLDNDVPFITIGIIQGNKEKIINLPIMIDMEPMTTYTYTISIVSNEFYVTVISSDWDDVTVDDGTFGEIAKYTIDIDSGIMWEDNGEVVGSIQPVLESEEIDYTTENSSNCYILNPSATKNRYFYIPIARIDEFWGDANYVTDADKRTNNVLSAVGDDWEAVMIWSDFNNSLTMQPLLDFRLERTISPSNNQAVRVFLPAVFADPVNHCNITYAIRKKSTKEILWSWHLWITDYDPNGLIEQYQSQIEANIAKAYGTNEGGRKNEIHRYNGKLWDDEGIYRDKFIMDRNLGARSPDFEGHGSILSMNGYAVTSPGSLYYQFGRKDPFPNYKVALYVNGYVASYYANWRKSFEYIVNGPTKFLSNYDSQNWCTSDVSQSDDYLWNDYTVLKDSYISGKSIFDPSPLGFRLPIDGTWADFTGSNESDETTNPEDYTFLCSRYLDPIPDHYNYGRIYKGFAYIPASGYRLSSDLSYGSESSYLWSATPYLTYKARCLRFTTTYGDNYDYYNRIFGFPVRPIQE